MKVPDGYDSEEWCSSKPLSRRKVGMLGGSYEERDRWMTGYVQKICERVVCARFRNCMKKPELIVPGNTYSYEIDLWSTGQVFLKDHKIRLEVASSAFDTFFPNPNTGELIGKGAKSVKAAQRISTIRSMSLLCNCLLRRWIDCRDVKYYTLLIGLNSLATISMSLFGQVRNSNCLISLIRERLSFHLSLFTVNF